MGNTPFALLDGQWQDLGASTTILYRGTQFLLDFDLSDQTNPSVAEYRSAVHPIHNPGPGLQDAVRDFLKILVRRVKPIIDRLVELDTTRRGHSVTLQHLLLTPHFRLHVDQFNSVSTYEQPTGPTLHLKPLSLAQSDPNDIARIPRIPASDVVIQDFDPSRPSLQGIVHVRNRGIAFFKPIENGREAEIVREIHIQNRLQELSITSTFRTSTIMGVTAASSDDHISGILLRWIAAKTLAEIEPDMKIKHAGRWRKQSAEFLERIHAEGLAWGDINECNVLVDSEDDDECGDAWAIDFGGKTGTNYDLEELQQLQAQDWLELEKVFDK